MTKSKKRWTARVTSLLLLGGLLLLVATPLALAAPDVGVVRPDAGLAAAPATPKAPAAKAPAVKAPAAAGFKPWTPKKEQVSAPLFVVLAYSAIWLAVLAFVVSIWRRQRRVEQELQTLISEQGKG